MRIIIYVFVMLITANTALSDVTRKVVKRYFNNSNREIIYYQNGKETAKEVYSEDGRVKSTTGRIPDGIVKEYYSEGNLMTEWNYKDGLFEGLCKMYYKDGKIMAESNYKNGILNGISKKYYKTGDIESEKNFKNGKLEGASETYYSAGMLKTTTIYKNGIEDGIAKIFYESGNIRSEWSCKNGKFDGIVKTYFEDGRPESEINYINGEKDGIGKRYQNDGSEIFIEEYKKDKLLNIKKVRSIDGKTDIQLQTDSENCSQSTIGSSECFERLLFMAIGFLIGIAAATRLFGFIGKGREKKIEKNILRRLFLEIESNLSISMEKLTEYRAGGGKTKTKYFFQEMSSKEWHNLLLGGEISLIKDVILAGMLHKYYSKVEYILFIEKMIPFQAAIKTKQESKEEASRYLNLLIMELEGPDDEKGIIKMGEKLLHILKRDIEHKN
jgi:antitoxin component YwqK of YwqJK toxin-antitoxin module